MGDNWIEPIGHIKMMAAVQPFLSGAISKTVNLPHSASVDDVQDLYKEAWQSGIKAVAIYRDNCKVAQPLTVDGSEGTSPANIARSIELMLRSLKGSDCPVLVQAKLLSFGS